MNNITIERVIKAYESDTVKPGFAGWGDLEKNCGCGMTAVVMNERKDWYPSLEEVLDNIDANGSNEICEAANVRWPYMLGFTDGFDGLAHGTSDQTGNADVWEMVDAAEYDMGYDHGKAARLAVFEKYFPDGYLVTKGEEQPEAMNKKEGEA
jgi:hypothetical protein